MIEHTRIQLANCLKSSSRCFSEAYFRTILQLNVINAIKAGPRGVYRMQKATTWVDRITDEKNPWLNAIRLEERGDLGSAAELYLQDASENLASGHVARAALAASSAAACIETIGFREKAMQLYSKVALLYTQNAARVARTSIRELMWSLWESGQYHLICGEGELAEAMYRKYSLVASRVELFGGVRTLRLFEEEGERRKQMTGSAEPPAGDWSELLGAVDSFLKKATGDRVRPAHVAVSRSKTAGRADYEKNFINQLG